MTIKVHHLRPAPGAKTAKTRVGRGEGSKGKTAGRGTKGTGARKNVSPRFEGGQMPLHMRLPKLKGFKNPFRVEYHAINLDTIEATGATEVSPETLRAAGLKIGVVTSSANGEAVLEAADLSQFGVNLTRLKPGAASSLRHWHENEDEFVYILAGVLLTLAVAAAILTELNGPDAVFMDGASAMSNMLVLMHRGMSIAGGTSEIKRSQIGERILGLPRDPLIK